ncbi:hypothetical protein [Corynebacterium resistens]|uniref:hypothetical protein n=1 Tax=Corynebacterium resistens TaxID=258224 RepID=UPI002355859C|nr:hypothetical protein [Corynebacterium resistens]
MTPSTPTTILADYQHSFLNAPSFWNVILIIGGILVIIGVITSGTGILRKAIRLPLALIGWVILWFVLMTIGSLFGGASESFVNDDINHPSPTTTYPTEMPSAPSSTVDLNQLFDNPYNTPAPK